MSFFADDAEPPEPVEPDHPRLPWRDEPDDRIPGLAAISRVLAVSDHVAVALIGARVYSDGVALLIERRLRRAGSARRDWQEMTRSFSHHFADPEDRVRYGVLLSDGRRATTSDVRVLTSTDRDEPPDAPVLLYRGGGGGGGAWFHNGHDTLWLWPLPPPGELQLVLQWPAFGLEESRTVLDAEHFRAAAAASAPLWPADS